MTKDDIMEMAYEAGIQEAFSLQHDQVLVQFQNGSLERFAALVSDHVREKCAKVCDSWVLKDSLAADMAKEIRARGNSES